VLVVDDDADMRHVWELWLTFWGFAVEEATNGLEAVRKAAAYRPHIVLMDIWMPQLDGLAATQQIKANPNTRDIPVLALSADSYPPAPQNALNAGCKAFLEKPVLPQALLDAIRLALHPPSFAEHP
jgi:CheY-like chemotaxis protein